MSLIQEGSHHMSMVQLRRKRLELHITYDSIIKIVAHSSKNLIEIKWCSQSNNSLISTYLQYTSLPEKRIWMKEMFRKLFGSFYSQEIRDSESKTEFLNLINVSDYCEISLCGFLTLDNSIIHTADYKDQVFAVLLHSNENQLNYFKKLLILIKPNESKFEIIDLRKATLAQNETYIRINHLNKVFIFQKYFLKIYTIVRLTMALS